MTTRTAPAEARQLTTSVGSFVVVASALLAARTALAAAHPTAALLLLLWIVADTMTLGLMARTCGRPGVPAVLATLAAACATVAFGAPPSLQYALRTMPVIPAAMALIVAGHLASATLRARQVYAAPASSAAARLRAAASEILPPALVRLAAAEVTVIHMALFRWGGPADVPEGARAFPYHRHLAPMCAALLVLSAIEMAVYHLLVGHWSRTAALAMFVLSDVGFLYLVGLVKSFRFRPILLEPTGVRVRAGLLINRFVPFEEIAGVETGFTGDSVRDSATLNAALLAWPNVLLRLRNPLTRNRLLGSPRPMTAIAFRLDEPEPFVRQLSRRLGREVPPSAS